MRVPGIPYVQGRNDYTDWDGRKYGIAIHNTSNDASDEDEASYATRRTDGVSSHLYADGDSVTQSLDTDDRAGHAGSREGNDHSLAVEITGGNGKSRQWWLDNVAWDRLGWVLAWIITNDPDYEGFEVRRASVAEMRANPRVKAFYGHDDMRLAWGGTTHTDPGRNFPWDRLFQAVNEHLEGEVSWTEKLSVPKWVRERWGRWPAGTMTAESAQVSGYAWSRLASDRAGEAVQKVDALLRLQGGESAEQILTQIAEHHQEEMRRLDALDAQMEAASGQRAELAELVRQGQSGEVEAAEVVRLIGERLTAAAAGDEQG